MNNSLESDGDLSSYDCDEEDQDRQPARVGLLPTRVVLVPHLANRRARVLLHLRTQQEYRRPRRSGRSRSGTAAGKLTGSAAS